MQNTEKSPGNLRRFGVTQSPMKDPSANADFEKLPRYNYSSIMEIKKQSMLKQN